MALHPCTRCDRHVRHSEARCPFCGEALPAMSGESASTPRMTRAAMVLGAAVALSACEKPQPSPSAPNNPPVAQPQPQPQPNLNDPNAVAAIYGAPPVPSQPDAAAQAQPDIAPSAPQDPGAAAARYGAPPPGGGLQGLSGLGAARYGAPPAFEHEA